SAPMPRISVVLPRCEAWPLVGRRRIYRNGSGGFFPCDCAAGGATHREFLERDVFSPASPPRANDPGRLAGSDLQPLPSLADSSEGGDRRRMRTQPSGRTAPAASAADRPPVGLSPAVLFTGYTILCLVPLLLAVIQGNPLRDFTRELSA